MIAILRLLLVFSTLVACSLSKPSSDEPTNSSINSTLLDGIWLSSATEFDPKDDPKDTTQQLLVVKDRDWSFLFLNRSAAQCADSKFMVTNSILSFSSDGSCPRALNRNFLSAEILQLDSNSLKIAFLQSESSKYKIQFERIDSARARQLIEAQCFKKQDVSSLFGLADLKDCTANGADGQAAGNSGNFKTESKKTKLVYARTDGMDSIRGVKNLQVLRSIDMTKLNGQGVYFSAGLFSPTVPAAKRYCKLKSFNTMVVPVGALIAIRDASDAPEFGQAFWDFESSEPLSSLICYVEAGIKPRMSDFEDAVGDYLQLVP